MFASCRIQKLLWMLVLLAGLLGSQSRVLAQPSNDKFSNAITISGQTGGTSGTNVGATVETNEPPFDVIGRSVSKETVWYRWTAPTTGGETFRVTSTVPLLCRIYTGSLINNLTQPQYNAAG